MIKDDDTLLDTPEHQGPGDKVDLPENNGTFVHQNNDTPTTQFVVPTSNKAVDPDNRKTDAIRVISDVGVTTERDLIPHRYAIIERIGGGAMAEVYRATDKMLSVGAGPHEVALKVFAHDNPWGEQAEARIKNEVALARRVVSPYVAQVFDLTRFPDGRWAIVQELVHGRTLTSIMNEGFERDWLRMTRWTIQIAKAIHAAHTVGVVHRDLKPENIMIQHDDTAKTLDFGVAKLFGRRRVSLTKRGNVVGTLLYMAPEQLNSVTDPRSDIYALGLTMFRLATGIVPRSGDRTADGIILARVQDPAPVHLRDVVPDAPPEFASVVDRMLMTHPRDRFQTGADIVQELESYLMLSAAETQVIFVADLFPPTVLLDSPPRRPPPPPAPSHPVSARVRGVPSNGISTPPVGLVPRKATPTAAETPPRLTQWLTVLLAALVLMLLVLFGSLARAAEESDLVRPSAATAKPETQPRTCRG